MKDKSQLNNLPNNVNLKASSINIIFNVIIVLLLVIVAYMAYSLYMKVEGLGQQEITENKKSTASVIQVEVLNGCGVGGVADNFTEFLRNNHFDVVQMGNYISYDVEKSIVIDRTGKMSNAYKVADILGISSKNVIQQINGNYFLDVSIIIGKDFNNLKPYQ